MNNFLRKVHAQARKNPKRIVFPEGTEERTLQAIEQIVQRKIAQPILLGNPQSIKKTAKKLKLKIDWKQLQIIDNKKSKLLKEFADKFYELRRNKGITPKQAAETIKDNNYFGTMMLHLDYADGMITGTTVPTHVSILPGLQILKNKEKFHKVSGVFFMILEKHLLLFADAVVNVDPNSHDLADIASDTAQTAKRFGLTPRIAFLSFSTKGSADHPYTEKMREATSILKHQSPELLIDGELQVDAALVPAVAKRKCPNSPIKGNANILIFPDLQSGNIAYKLVERLAKAKAVGPLLQGLSKPVNDLSRGCSVEDIINVTALTVCECN